jgi:ATP-dependent Lon protease
MTGEITLAGLVLPVGGIKEKVLAARRAGIHRVILPRENERNLRDIPAHVREELEFVLIDTVHDLLKEVVPALNESQESQTPVEIGV